MPTSLKYILFIALLILCQVRIHAQYLKLQNTEHPRLLMTQKEEAQIKSAIATDQQWEMMHRLLIGGADKILIAPVSERTVIGRRLLEVSRETLRRILLLGYAYRITGDLKYSTRAQEELLAVSDFQSWNPSHFLDVAEMTTAVAIGYDWFYSVLSAETKDKIKVAILEKGIQPSFNEKYNDWLNRVSNWNQVCNTGMVYGVLAIYEDIPELANFIIGRSVESVKKPMEAYAPSGAYPEGYSYWAFGTTYNVMLIDALEKNFGTDLNLLNQPGFLQTAEYVLHMVGPDKKSFNYGDNSSSGRMSPPMFWFANKNNDPSLLYNEMYLFKNGNKDKLVNYRYFTLGIIWGTAINTHNIPQPVKTSWVSGHSKTPVALMRTSWDRKSGIFVGFKGGTAQTGHAHLDAGSFIMVTDSIRWAMDFDRQDYNSIESKGIDLWGKHQDSDRWKVFRHNNMVHNTLSFNNEYQQVDGYVAIEESSGQKNFCYAISDLTPVYSNQIAKAIRGIAIVDEQYVVVRDEIKTGNKETTIRWTMLTPATATIKDGSIIELSLKNKKLNIEIESTLNAQLKTWNTTPIAEYDAANPGTILVGFEVNVPKDTEINLQVKLVPENAKNAKGQIPNLKAWSEYKK